MKKILLSSVLCASLMFAADNGYNYEITPMIGGTITEGNLDLEDHYGNAGLSLGFNLDKSSIFDQVELGFLRSLGDVDYSDGSDTAVTRIFTNFVKDYKISDSMSLYALIGAGIEVFEEEKFGNEDGLFGNYGFGLRYELGNDLALKTDVRHLIETDHGDNNLLYTVGLAIPFGKKAVAAPKVEEPVKEEPVVMPLKEVEGDADGDGVADSKDKCPNSSPVAVVDANGCEADSDGDGVVDSKDQCPNTPKGDIVDKAGCSLKVDLNINFKFDSAQIDTSYESKIKKFAQFMKQFPSVKAKIEAHTDATGTEEYNQKLSERRAASAVKALKAYGIEATRLKSIGYGESKPLATNATAEGRAENRRVEGTIQQ